MTKQHRINELRQHEALIAMREEADGAGRVDSSLRSWSPDEDFDPNTMAQMYPYNRPASGRYANQAPTDHPRLTGKYVYPGGLSLSQVLAYRDAIKAVPSPGVSYWDGDYHTVAGTFTTAQDSETYVFDALRTFHGQRQVRVIGTSGRSVLGFFDVHPGDVLLVQGVNINA